MGVTHNYRYIKIPAKPTFKKYVLISKSHNSTISCCLIYNGDSVIADTGNIAKVGSKSDILHWNSGTTNYLTYVAQVDCHVLAAYGSSDTSTTNISGDYAQNDTFRVKNIANGPLCVIFAWI